jgi:hypothetical protein
LNIAQTTGKCGNRMVRIISDLPTDTRNETGRSIPRPLGNGPSAADSRHALRKRYKAFTRGT